MRPALSLALLLALAALAASCRGPSGAEEDSGRASAAAVGPGPVVTGTVVDARTGKPVAGALVRGPAGVEAKSDARGRFVLSGLAPGASGELVATAESGLSGRNVLRPLAAGPLEVVLYVR
jgi:hypothetical protein